MTIGFPAQNIAIQTPHDVIEPIWYDKLKAVEAVLNSLLASQANAEAAWTAYTPAFSSTAGTITSATTTGRYRQVGKTVNFTAQINITINGTGSGFIRLGVPAAGGSMNQAISGRENLLTGKALVGVITPGSTNAVFSYYDDTYPGANGNVLTISGSYETA